MWLLGEKHYSLCLNLFKIAKKQWNTKIKKLIHNQKKQHKMNWKKICKIAKVTTTKEKIEQKDRTQNNNNI